MCNVIHSTKHLLCCVINTGSFMWLWSVSLAHSDITLCNGLFLALTNPPLLFTSDIIMERCRCVSLVLTDLLLLFFFFCLRRNSVLIIVVTEGLPAFLHTLLYSTYVCVYCTLYDTRIKTA